MEAKKPSYLGLLNAIALGEGRAHQYLSCWAAKTPDPDVKQVILQSDCNRLKQLARRLLRVRDPDKARALLQTLNAL